MLCSCWITSDGKILDTGYEISHRQAIKMHNLQHFIDDNIKKIQWSDDELNRHLNSDDVLCLLKLGYIRVLIYDRSIGIQYENVVDANKQYNAIKSFLESNYRLDDNYSIVCEKLSTFDSFTIESILELKNFLFERMVSHS